MTLLQYNCLKRKCADCCGPVPIPMGVYEKHKALLPLDTVVVVDDKMVYATKGDSIRCAFLDVKSFSCLIYEDRPVVCQDFGTIDDLPCPFLLPNGCKRSRQDARAIQRKINKNVDSAIKRMIGKGD